MHMDAGFPQQGSEGLEADFGACPTTAPLRDRRCNGHRAAVESPTRGARRGDGRTDGCRGASGSVQLTAAFEIAEARVRLDQARRAVEVYQDGVMPLARRNLETVRETYELGRATVLDVLTEQRRFLETERGYTEALREAHASRVLDRATGDVR